MRTTLDLKDDRLVTPPQKLSSTSHLTFWHRFQFEDGFDGGALEVSTDGGATWVDVVAGGGSFVSGGYNGSISGSFGSPIASRPAWTGGSSTAATDSMTQVIVNLGAFAGLDRLVRFRLAADRLAVGSLPGQGWWIDDVQFTNTLVEGACPSCLEDDDSRIAYSNGWHLINYTSASGGHFRYHSGNSPQHFANLDFTVPAGSTGSISYAFAKSPKGGTADIYLDGVFKQTVSYAGSVGSTQAPEFKPEYNVQYGNLTAGAHKLELKNLTGVVYVDRFCLTNSNSNAQPASGPGNTTNQPGTASTGQTSSTNYQMPSGSQEISVVAEASLNVPFKLAVINPSGLTLQTVDATNGTAVLNTSVTQNGVYVIKVINVSLGPLQFTTTATPLVKR